MNTFVFRFFCVTPALFALTIMISVFIVSFIEVKYAEIITAPWNIFGRYFLLIVPITFGLGFYLLVRLSFTKTDHAEQRFAENDFEFYVYLPQTRIPSGHAYGSKYRYSRNEFSNNLLVGEQIGTLILDTDKIQKSDAALTGYGEFIVSRAALDILNEEKLTGFQFQPVIYGNEKLPFQKQKYFNEYFQLSALHVLPEMSDETEIIKGHVPGLVVVPKDYLIYYPREAMTDALDFNLSKEYFGSNSAPPHNPQRYWIISKRALDILQNRLYLPNQNFIPVYLIENETK
jgi:hypothetical protein